MVWTRSEGTSNNSKFSINLYSYLWNLCNEFNNHLDYYAMKEFLDDEWITCILGRRPHSSLSFHQLPIPWPCICSVTQWLLIQLYVYCWGHVYVRMKKKTYWKMFHRWLHFPLLYALYAQHAWALNNTLFQAYSFVIRKKKVWTRTKKMYMYIYYTSHGPTSQGKKMVVKAAKYSRENLEGGIITLICPTEQMLSIQEEVK